MDFTFWSPQSPLTKCYEAVAILKFYCRWVQDFTPAMRGVGHVGHLHVCVGMFEDGWSTPWHVHGRVHVRQLLRPRHQRQPHQPTDNKQQVPDNSTNYNNNRICEKTHNLPTIHIGTNEHKLQHLQTEKATKVFHCIL